MRPRCALAKVDVGEARSGWKAICGPRALRQEYSQTRNDRPGCAGVGSGLVKGVSSVPDYGVMGLLAPKY